MFLDVRMVGTALERQIQSNFDPERLRFPDQACEICERSQLWKDRLVTARFSADRPRAARVAGGADHDVVLALAMSSSDRMDRRQIENVETHRCDVGKHV